MEICDLWRLSEASWVSTLICDRTRNPKTGAECSQSWSATGSTAPSPAGNPPPPTWNSEKSFICKQHCHGRTDFLRPCWHFLKQTCLTLHFWNPCWRAASVPTDYQSCWSKGCWKDHGYYIQSLEKPQNPGIAKKKGVGGFDNLATSPLIMILMWGASLVLIHINEGLTARSQALWPSVPPKL